MKKQYNALAIIHRIIKSKAIYNEISEVLGHDFIRRQDEIWCLYLYVALMQMPWLQKQADIWKCWFVIK